jgi:hypothetical protein
MVDILVSYNVVVVVKKSLTPQVDIHKERSTS